MKKIETKYIVAIVISLIMGASILGYGYMDYRYKKEALEQKIRSEQRAKDDEQLTKNKEQQTRDKVKQGLETCIAGAEKSYNSFWFSECKDRGQLTNRCISLHEMTFEEYAKQNNIPFASETIEERLKALDDFQKQQDDCSCLLPKYNADRIDESLKRDKDECFRRYPQN